MNYQQKFVKPKKLLTSFTFVGTFYSLIALTFSSFIQTFLFLTCTPSMGISVVLKLYFNLLKYKLYFNLLKYKLYFSVIFRNLIVYFSSSSFVFTRITKSSIQFARLSLYNSFLNMLVIICQKVASELYSSKYITFGLNSPLFIKKATFHLLHSFICMLLYSQIKSNLLKYFTSFNLSITLLIRSILSLTMC